MISVFTPSHDPRYLDEAYESLRAQTYKDWEWVVLLNNGAKWEKPDDSRVHLFNSETGSIIGALKGEAVSECVSRYLVELDHDDKLMPNALEEIVKAFESDPAIGFVSSDFSQINADGTPNLDQFSGDYGWEYYNDGEYRVCAGMDVHPHNISYIWYAPNHVRAFRRSAYEASGGYDSYLDVLDDQDLIARLYNVTKFHHIHKNLYLQRIHGFNTQSGAEKNAKIQHQTVAMYDRTIEKAMLNWATDNKLLALDLGGAHNPADGYKTVDQHPPADFVGDIFDVLAKMDDNTVGLIRAVDFLEHIPQKISLWNEFYRVLASGGMVLSLTPSTDGRGAYQDPTHNSFYNENSFWYFSVDEYRKYVPELKMDFHISRLVTYFPSDWHREHDIPYVCCNLVAVKGPAKLGGLKSI